LGEKIPLNVTNSETGDIIIPSNRKITKTLLRRLSSVHRYIDIPPSPVRIKVFEIIESYESKFNDLEDDRDRKIESIEQGDSIDQGAIKNVRVFVAKSKRCASVIKWPVDMETKVSLQKLLLKKICHFYLMVHQFKFVLIPWGSKSNECWSSFRNSSWVGLQKLGFKVATPIFDGISESELRDYLKEANLPETGKTILYDGCTGNLFIKRLLSVTCTCLN
jgi:DNA-directed RNA polymerase subunit beta